MLSALFRGVVESIDVELKKLSQRVDNIVSGSASAEATDEKVVVLSTAEDRVNIFVSSLDAISGAVNDILEEDEDLMGMVLSTPPFIQVPAEAHAAADAEGAVRGREGERMPAMSGASSDSELAAAAAAASALSTAAVAAGLASPANGAGAGFGPARGLDARTPLSASALNLADAAIAPPAVGLDLSAGPGADGAGSGSGSAASGGGAGPRRAGQR